MSDPAGIDERIASSLERIATALEERNASPSLHVNADILDKAGIERILDIATSVQREQASHKRYIDAIHAG